MNRKEYWNKNYAEYFKLITDEAEIKGSSDSKIKKISGHDYKTPGIEVITSIFDKLSYSVDDTLLDYGCGLGRFFPYFSDKCVYYGIDISQAMIDECQKQYPDYADRFIVSEGESLPFEDDYFDKLICYGVFDACYQEQALQEMLRVCKMGGELIISGKNALYYSDDEEAYIAEENARKKEHPNYFTDVANMLSQLKRCCDIIDERYALRRGDFGKGKFVFEMPDVFYEWVIIVKKRGQLKGDFDKFADAYSKTWKRKNSIF